MTSTNSLPDRSRTRAVIFDLGKVLVDFDYRIAARAMSPHSRLAPDQFKQVIDQSPLLGQYESGRLTTAEFEAEVRRLTGYGGSPDHFREAFANIFEEIPEMTRLKDEIRQRGIPAFIFSNTNEIAVEHIRRQFPFFEGFDGFVLSYEIGAIKPDAEAYAAVERATGFRGPELLYLDDRADNIAGARPHGWQAILHETPAATRGILSNLLTR